MIYLCHNSMCSSQTIINSESKMIAEEHRLSLLFTEHFNVFQNRFDSIIVEKWQYLCVWMVFFTICGVFLGPENCRLFWKFQAINLWCLICDFPLKFNVKLASRPKIFEDILQREQEPYNMYSACSIQHCVY